MLQLHHVNRFCCGLSFINAKSHSPFFSFLVLWPCTLLCKLGMHEGRQAVLVVLKRGYYSTLLKGCPEITLSRYLTQRQDNPLFCICASIKQNLLPGPLTHCHPANLEALQNAACCCLFSLLLLREPGFAQADSQCQHLTSLPAPGVGRNSSLQVHQSSPEPRNLQLCLWRTVQ